MSADNCGASILNAAEKTKDRSPHGMSKGLLRFNGRDFGKLEQPPEQLKA
jgi:hypothetical protein